MKVRFIILASFLSLFAAGCATTGRRSGDPAVLERHVVTLTDQVKQLDQALIEAQNELAAERNKNAALQAGLNQGRSAAAGFGSETAELNVLYRTPNGFELPAKDIQLALKNAGYYSGTVDGQIGPDSRKALRDFQRDNGLTADSICGQKTWDKLKSHLNANK